MKRLGLGKFMRLAKKNSESTISLPNYL